MKNKLSKWKDRAEFLFDLVRDYPKTSMIVLLVLASSLFVGFKVITRVPDATACTYKAWFRYSLPSEKWRFQWIDNACQRLRSDGVWVDMESAKDAAGLE